jgi:hypothetical protein
VSIKHIRNKNQTLRPFGTREGAATRKIKTASKGEAPARTLTKDWATRRGTPSSTTKPGPHTNPNSQRHRRGKVIRAIEPKGLASGPEGYGDEENLHRDTEPKACSRLAAKSYAGACSVNIGGQDGQEKSNQRIGGGTTEFGNEKSYRSRDFTDAREIDQRARPRNRRRHHANELFLHECEMGDACENEHKAQRITRGRLPSGKSRNARETEPPKNKAREDQNYQYDHETSFGLLENIS